jgi:hypothetical protein
MAVHELPPPAAATKSNQFHFKLPGSRKSYSMPYLKHLPIGIRQKLADAGRPLAEAKKAGRDADPADAAVLGNVQLAMVDRYCPGLTEELDQDQLNDLLKTWVEASGISVGESQASAGS